MEDPTEFSAAIVFNAGNSEHDFSIDNVSLKEVIAGSIVETTILPTLYSLDNNFPNPFNPRTVISYQLSVISEVDLSIYNLLGQRVATLVNERQNAGSHQVEWDASGFTSGIYYYMIRAGEFKSVKKMMLIK